MDPQFSVQCEILFFILKQTAKKENKMGICNSTCLSQDRKPKPGCARHKISKGPSMNFAILEQSKQLVAPCCFQSQSGTHDRGRVVGSSALWAVCSGWFVKWKEISSCARVTTVLSSIAAGKKHPELYHLPCQGTPGLFCRLLGFGSAVSKLCGSQITFFIAPLITGPKCVLCTFTHRT